MTRTGIARLGEARLNMVADTYPGGGTAAPGSAPGQLGHIIEINANDVKYNATVGTLYGAKYQYVQVVRQAQDCAPAVGLMCFWLDRAAFTVTTVVTGYDIAGVFINALTDLQYGWICIDGKCKVRMAANVTKVAPAKGDLCLAVAADVVDVLLDATALTSVEVAKIVGVICDDGAIAADGALVQVALKIGNENS